MKTLFISGAARRIGAHLATYFHDQGFQILLHYHQSRHEAQTLCKQLLQKRPDSVHLIQADLNKKTAAKNIFDQICQYTDSLDVLIHNASMFSKHDQDWDALFQINVSTPYFLSRLAYPLLKKRQGCIINITDIHAEKPLKEYPAYTQTKAALLMQTQALALEFAPDVRVNAIAPGISIWPEQDNSLSPELKEKILEKIPMHCLGGAEPIALAADCLIKNHYMTGTSIYLDGGQCIK